MADTTKSGVYQLENGMWGFRYTVTYNGKRKDVKRQKDELGRILKTEKAALRARESAMLHDKMNRIKKPVEKRMTFAEVYQEYCEMGRSGKAYATIKKQDSLWKNHLAEKFGNKFIDEISVADAEQLKGQREQNQTFIEDLDGEKVSSLELVNSLSNGKIQTVNSMKYHSRTIKTKLGIDFKFHHLRHTYGTRLAELNTPTHILCNQMGHASGKVTERYYLAVSKSGIDILVRNLNAI